MYKKDHENGCPGFIEVNFFGTNASTYALLLRNQKAIKSSSLLLVFTKGKKSDWDITELEKDIDGASAIWSEPPGKYGGEVDDEINAKYPIVLLVGYESWAIAYFWTGKSIEKVWLSD